MPQINYTINSGFSVGSPVDLRQYGEVRAIGIPAITSADLFIQGAMTLSGGVPPNSGDYSRLLETRAVQSGHLRFFTGPGSCWLPFPLGDVMPPWIRPELGVAQGADRTFTILIRN
jgi:hypothetical protein